MNPLLMFYTLAVALGVAVLTLVAIIQNRRDKRR